MKNYSVPFYKNTEDDTHCVQACYKMVLKYFWPEKDFTWEELDKITNKKEGLWTWPMAGLTWMAEQGFDVEYIEAFDYTAFLTRTDEYLLEKFGPEVAAAQKKYSDITSELAHTKAFLEKVYVKNYSPNFNEIKKYIDNGYLVVASINSKALYNKPGYIGHSVIVKGYENDTLIVHDPGLPGVENHPVSKDQFTKAWSYPDTTANNITAIKL